MKKVESMRVKVLNKIYRMNNNEYKGLLGIASEQVPFGIYAIEKKGYAELMNLKCKSITQLKKYQRTYKAQGFKVYANKE